MKFIMMMIMMLMSSNYASMILIIFMFNMSMTQSTSKMSNLMVVDQMSFWMISLSMWVSVSIMHMKHKDNKKYEKLLMVICLTLLISFSAWNFLMFYITFEISMISMLTLIVMWGYQPDRMQAAMFMLMITLTFSMPFFTAILMKSKTIDFMNFSTKISTLNFLMMIIMLSVKVPIFMLHMWLPKAHVESPTSGSILLAAVMLKLGMYGIIRLSITLVKFKKMAELSVPIMIWGAMVLSMINLIQTDIKMIVAYSSIVHMMVALPNIMIYKQKSVIAAMLTMVGHGLCSATMFMMIGVIYKNSKSRSLIMNKMNTNMTPSITTIWFITCMNNAPMPPSMNMMAEVMTMMSIHSWSSAITMMMLMIMFSSSMYSIYLFYITSHAKSLKTMKMIKKSSTEAMNTMMMLTLPTMAVTIKPTLMII